MVKFSKRTTSFGQLEKLRALDQLGNYLSIRIISRFMNTLEDVKKGHLLDLGSGYHARISAPFFKEFTKVSLVDIQVNPTLLKKYGHTIAYNEDALDALKKMEQESVDVVLGINVIEHLSNREEIFLEIYRILKVSGEAIIQVPTWRSRRILELLAFRFGIIPKDEIEDHKLYFSGNELWVLARSNGFLPSNIKTRYKKFGLVVTAHLKK